MTPADHVTTAAISAVGDYECDQPIELSADATECHVAARFERDAIPVRPPWRAWQKPPGVDTQWQPLPRPMAEVEWMPSVNALVGCECRKEV
jgi:hypothetical protein